MCQRSEATGEDLRDWQFGAGTSTQQTDSVNCGIFVLMVRPDEAVLLQPTFVCHWCPWITLNNPNITAKVAAHSDS